MRSAKRPIKRALNRFGSDGENLSRAASYIREQMERSNRPYSFSVSVAKLDGCPGGMSFPLVRENFYCLFKYRGQFVFVAASGVKRAFV